MLEKTDQTRKWEDERLELIRSSGTGGTVLFWIGGVAFVICVVEAWSSGSSSTTGFGLATSIGVLIWGGTEQSKKASADRKIAQLDAYLDFARKGRL